MLLLDIIRVSTRSFKNNRLRTALTVLGIGIGIGVIFFLVSLGYGLQKLTLDKIATADSLLTLDVVQESDAVTLNNNSLQSLASVEDISEISPVIIQESQVNREGFVVDLKINIVDANFFKLEGVAVKAGELFADSKENEMVVSGAVLRLLNLTEDDLGKAEIFVKILTDQEKQGDVSNFIEKKYLLKGVVEDESQTYAYINRKSVAEIDFDKYDKIKVKVGSDEKLEEVREYIINQGYYVSAISDLVNQAKQIFKISQVILALFGIVALVVSAVGMFNTMTITLLERTQEIGIMKTLGASSFDIWKMFLVESIAIGFSGGVIGMTLGYLGGKLFNAGINILARNLDGVEVELFFIPTWFVFFILTFSVVVGAVTGFYPARRAAKLNSLEALRYK